MMFNIRWIVPSSEAIVVDDSLMVALLGNGDTGGCLTLALYFIVGGNACGTGEDLLLLVVNMDDDDDDTTMGLRPRGKRKRMF